MGLRLECLGGFAMTQDGERVALSPRKPRMLAGILAVARRRTMSRQRLAALLWEDSDGEQARVSLRQALAQIRRAAGDGWIEAEGDDLRLGPGVATDLDAFHDALARNDPAEAVRLYRGPLLEGLEANTSDLAQALAEHRARLATLVTDALSRELERMGDSPDAAALAHRLLGHDPLNEAAHRRLMTLDAARARDGDPEAHAELHSCRASIRRTRGDMAGALEDYRTAHALATRAETRVAMLTRQALVLHRLGQGDEADLALDAAEEIADSIGLAGPVRAEIHEQRGNRAFVRGDHAACMAHHTAALAAAEIAGDPRGIARGHGGIGDAAYAAGRFTTAYGHFTKAIETAERAGLGLVREEYMFMRAFSLFFADPGPQAFLLADVAVDSAVQCGAARTELIAREIRAEMRTANGDLIGLEEDLVAISKLATARGETRFMKDVQTLYAYLHMRRGDLRTAREYIEPLLEDACSDAYIGGKILGLAALLAEDRDTRDDWIAKGRECLARGSLAHSVFWYHASVLERAVMDGDQALAREEIDAMFAFAAKEPIGIMSLYIRTAELLLWPSSDADRQTHADVVRAACLEDCAQILLRPERDYARP